MAEATTVVKNDDERWWRRLIERLDRWHGTRSAEHHSVGTGYRGSEIHVPGHCKAYLRWLERAFAAMEGVTRYVSDRVDARHAIEHLRGLWAPACVVAGLLLIGVSLHWLLVTRNANAMVSETRWSYHVSVRERRIRDSSDWHDELHSHAFDLRCESRVRSHHDCDPYMCPGIDTFIDSRGRLQTRVTIHTCWHRCPDYDQWCVYHYPVWPTVADRELGGMDHAPVRPTLVAAGEQTCVEDDEALHDRGFSQCQIDALTYAVQFDAGAVGHWAIHPVSRPEFDRYTTGDHWRVRFNHAGSFEPIARVR